MRLAVELYGVVVGDLEGDDSRSFDFVASTAGIAEFGTNSSILGVELPLVARQTRAKAGRRRNWFAELLPEGDQYEYLRTQAGLRPGDVLGFLARYGRDVAGAVQLWDVDDPTEPRAPGTSPVDDSQIRALPENPLSASLGNLAEVGKSSLAGVQPKIVLAATASAMGGAQWSQAFGGYPSTHILKPRLSANPTVIFDEEYGARLARRLGLASFSTTVAEFDGLPALVVERFDRVDGARIHQEDFSQVLGASGNQKYQELGGVTSLKRVAQALRGQSRSNDLVLLARVLVLSVAVGNLDLHTKNLGLLHPVNGRTRLAPAYDVVPQAHQAGVDGRLALAVNGRYEHHLMERSDVVSELTSWGLRGAERLVNETLDEILAAVATEQPIEGSYPNLTAQIRTFTERLRAGKAVGHPLPVE
ncbi:type II toxin-antitoxin system HipA family toxin [Pseudoclavibacter sp. RFBG4]|uniref:type II toxin-antitoxin system HipA family toxin n=1 Tax=Pseudoclavibacter sp. RFBG4 TaxID=2080575 RepID=UPI000CE91E14|nr:HipA domain-containing protein [Pseudoclavibacter sp. RFBG4]PPG33614.1 type II toxin-antitoxin system HipA family toxin [Pseudoclavibacter sp. RFBG4]